MPPRLAGRHSVRHQGCRLARPAGKVVPASGWGKAEQSTSLSDPPWLATLGLGEGRDQHSATSASSRGAKPTLRASVPPCKGAHRVRVEVDGRKKTGSVDFSSALTSNPSKDYVGYSASFYWYRKDELSVCHMCKPAPAPDRVKDQCPSVHLKLHFVRLTHRI